MIDYPVGYVRRMVRHIDGSLLIVLATGCRRIREPEWWRGSRLGSRLSTRGIYRVWLAELFAALCARVEPGGIHLGLLEAARVTQCLPEGLLGTRPARSQGLAPYAPQTAFDHRLLETVFSLSRLTEYYARLNK